MAEGEGRGYFPHEGGGDDVDDLFERLCVARKASSGSEDIDGRLNVADRLRLQARRRSRDVIQ